MYEEEDYEVQDGGDEEGRELYGEEAIPLGPDGEPELEEFSVVDYDELGLNTKFRSPHHSSREEEEEDRRNGGYPPKYGRTPIRSRFPELGGNPFLQEEHSDFPRRDFEQPPRGGGGPEKHNRSPFGRPPPPSRSRPRKKESPVQSDLDVNVGIPPEFQSEEDEYPGPRGHHRHRPHIRERERPPRYGGNDVAGDSPPPHGPPRRHRNGARFPGDDELQRGFKPFFKPSRPYGQAFEDDEDVPSHKLFGGSEEEGRFHLDDGPVVGLGPPEEHRPFRSERRPPQSSSPRLPLSPVPPPHRGRPRPSSSRTTTPRPIPTPGPEDFPPPPPRRPPPPPPTHPTHPPKITHPPGHYTSQFRPPRVDFPDSYDVEEFDDDSR